MITHADQVTPAWLNSVLRANGLLPVGRVALVTAGETRAAFASTTCRLAVRYSGPVSSDAPRRLFLKTTDPALAPGAYDIQELDRELIFYTRVAPAMRADFIIPCYDAALDLTSASSYILLKDVSETHAACRDPLEGNNSRKAVETLARLHAAWWDHPRLGQDVGKFPTAKERAQEWANAEECTTGFMAALGQQIPGPYRLVYERVLAALPGLYRRHESGRNLTLVHGDAHLGNFLFPVDRQGSPYLLDWQFWHPTIGGTDLAFMIATDWETETRRLLEHSLLEHYYHVLVENGVKGYSWQECWDDYRLSVILVSIFIPVWRYSVFHWEPDLAALQRSMAAFADLRCEELL